MQGFDISRDAHPLNKATYNDFYPYARDTMHLDFCAMTDHSDDITSSEWNTVKSLAAQYYNPGVFTTFIAEEWSSSTGHKNVYLPGDVVPPGPWSPADPNYRTPSQLWTASDAYGALTDPHHSQGGPAATDWSYSNDVHQRLVGVYSKWGSSEYDNADPIITGAVVKGNHSVQEALALGQKLGFVGETDSHSSLCGYLDANEGKNLWRNSAILKYRGGLTGVWATANTREAIWEALQNRRTFATTGDRILFWYTVDGQPMGSSITTNGNPVINVGVTSTTPLKTISILRDNVQIYTEEGFTGKIAATFSYTDTTITNGNHYYYVRLSADDANADANAEQAWASPVWVTETGRAATATPSASPTATATATPSGSPTATSTAPAETRFEYYNTGRDSSRPIFASGWLGQTFSPTATHTISRIKLELSKSGSPSTMTCSLRNTSGGLPSGADLTSATISSSGVSTSLTWIWIDLPDWGPLTAGTQYAIVCGCPDCNLIRNYNWGSDASSPTYAGGTGIASADGGKNWITGARDLMFEEWGY